MSIPSLPNILASYVPTEPISRIHEQKDIETFIKTKAFDRIMTFVMLINQSALKKKISDPCLISPVSFMPWTHYTTRFIETLIFESKLNVCLTCWIL